MHMMDQLRAQALEAHLHRVIMAWYFNEAGG